MQAIAERSGYVLVQLEERDPDRPLALVPGVVVNTRTSTVSEPRGVDSILARGYWIPFTGEEEPILALVSSAQQEALTAATRTYDETKHRRYPKGTPKRGKERGGQYAPKGSTGSGGVEKDWLKSEAQTAEDAYYKATRPRDAIATARGWLQENGFSEEAQGNHVQVVQAMQDHYPDGYEFFLSINDMHKEDFRRNYMMGSFDGPIGEYGSKRLEVHNGIRAAYLKDARLPAEGEQPMALFMAGGTASGKSSILGRQENGIFNGGVSDAPEHAVYVNPDDIKELLPEAKALRDDNDPRWAALAHEESSDIAARLRKDAEQAGFPMVIDGTGDAEGPSDRYPEGKFMQKVRDAERAGYRTKIVFVDIPTEEAIRRAGERAVLTGRRVSHEQIRNIHSNVVARHLEWRNTANDWEVWANDDPGQGGRRLIARRQAGGPLEIIDRERYAQMEAKGR